MTAETLTLTDFLLARIAEDEAAAQDALERGFGGWEWLADLGVHFEGRKHIARHDPARVLAECKAKRRIIYYEQHDWMMTADPEGFIFTPKDFDDRLNRADSRNLRALASIYADHEDFRAEWAL